MSMIARELAPPRERRVGLYTVVLQNRDIYEQMIYIWVCQVAGARGFGAIFQKILAVVFGVN
jgi:hypothetical protein